MKYCTNCGSVMADEVYTCTNCGCGPKITPPVKKLKTDRGLLKSFLLSFVTLGIYSFVLYGKLSSDLNETASRYDGKRTMNFALLLFLVGPFTLGIGFWVWFHKFSERVGQELKRRNINYSFGARTFWLWNVLGIFIVVGPFVYLHRLIKSINLINADYNVRG